MPSIGIIGECMIELAREENGLYRQRFGGDSYNTAHYLAQCARASGENIATHYVTLLGDDSASAAMIAAFEDAGVRCDLVGQLPGCVPGLYMIDTDEKGERSFRYWRGEAPARRLFQTEGSEVLQAALMEKDWLYFSGISLAILYPEGREALFALCEKFRAKGGKVAFDINYRPRLWRNVLEAREAIDRAYGLCDLALPSFDDEAALFGVKTAHEALARIAALGAGEIVVKNGAKGLLLKDETKVQELAVEAAAKVVDTTAAGDSFNAGYLWARFRGASQAEAAQAAAALARQVIAQPGAIVPVTPPSLNADAETRKP